MAVYGLMPGSRDVRRSVSRAEAQSGWIANAETLKRSNLGRRRVSSRDSNPAWRSHFSLLAIEDGPADGGCKLRERVGLGANAIERCSDDPAEFILQGLSAELRTSLGLLATRRGFSYSLNARAQLQPSQIEARAKPARLRRAVNYSVR